MNPLNSEAGETPAPTDALDLRVVESSAKVMWRAFPYFAWRYGERGRSFGRSDAGFLVTLLQHDENTAWQQVRWLAGLLVPRGMPSIVLEMQLESLARTAKRMRASNAARLFALAAHMRNARLNILSASDFEACESICRTANHGVAYRRGAGILIASAVVDRRLGFGEHDMALLQWLCNAEPQDRAWSIACGQAHSLALSTSVNSRDSLK